MATTPRDWRDGDAMDALFMAAAEDDPAAVRGLTEALDAARPTAASDWPPGVSDNWQAGVDLALETFDLRTLTPEQVALVERLAHAGLDSPRLRDGLAAAVRTEFSDYLDPAGLLTAIGVHDHARAVDSVYLRWILFRLLRRGGTVVDPRHGVGEAEGIDDITGHVAVRFGRVQTYGLPLALGTLAAIQPGSLLDALRTGEADWPPGRDGDADDPLAPLAAGLCAEAAPAADAVRQLLVPDIVTAEAFDAFLLEDTGRDENVEAGPGRRWDEARAIAELLDMLRRNVDLDDSSVDLENLHQIFDASGNREDHASDLCECVALLWKRCSDAPWLLDILTHCSDAVCWTNPQLFVDLSDALSGSLTPHWFGATLAAESPDYLARNTLRLPLRLWGHAQKVLLAHDVEELLRQAVRDAVAGSDVSADVLLWLWKSGGDDRALLASPALIFRTLEKPVKGSFIRANKDVRKLLMGNAEFQTLLMKGGTSEGIASLVRTVRHLPLLDTGERQSLLVKIVRIFPEARALVEERRRQPQRREVGRVTSARNYELRRRELEQLINEKIPANARAIAHARSYGDLRENAEYKAAKEEQAYLGARRGELEDGLHDIRATDFHDVRVNDVVIPGCSVTLEREGARQAYHVLGLWDSDPERRLLSYDTPLGQELLGQKEGSEVTLPSGEIWTIESVDALSDELLIWARGEDL